ncbi:MAG: ribosomal-processing cysteine protease Prp, partial [Lachnospiraceae bacterium]|nr:ribosomal-processing cysteine protease Prp [Lachnospiraceae bacterium]
MITVIFTKEGDAWKGVECSGHAGYADAGEDIYCSAVSALVTNTCNSLEVLTGDAHLVETDDGYLKILFSQTPSEKG